jgi:hypothetical protein
MLNSVSYECLFIVQDYDFILGINKLFIDPRDEADVMHMKTRKHHHSCIQNPSVNPVLSTCLFPVLFYVENSAFSV